MKLEWEREQQGTVSPFSFEADSDVDVSDVGGPLGYFIVKLNMVTLIKYLSYIPV